MPVLCRMYQQYRQCRLENEVQEVNDRKEITVSDLLFKAIVYYGTIGIANYAPCYCDVRDWSAWRTPYHMSHTSAAVSCYGRRLGVKSDRTFSRMSGHNLDRRMVLGVHAQL